MEWYEWGFVIFTFVLALAALFRTADNRDMLCRHDWRIRDHDDRLRMTGERLNNLGTALFSLDGGLAGLKAQLESLRTSQGSELQKVDAQLEESFTRIAKLQDAAERLVTAAEGMTESHRLFADDVRFRLNRAAVALSRQAEPAPFVVDSDEDAA